MSGLPPAPSRPLKPEKLVPQREEQPVPSRVVFMREVVDGLRIEIRYNGTNGLYGLVIQGPTPELLATVEREELMAVANEIAESLEKLV